MAELLILEFDGVTESEYRSVNAELGIDPETGLSLKGDELLIKAREAMIAAVHTFNSAGLTFGSAGGREMMTRPPRAVSVFRVWIVAAIFMMDTSPRARSTAEMSLKIALALPSTMTVEVGAPPPSGTSSITCVATSLISDSEMVIGQTVMSRTVAI